jgi:hypothetical protein
LETEWSHVGMRVETGYMVKPVEKRMAAGLRQYRDSTDKGLIQVEDRLETG